jgi:uncharacterized membrane protein YhiD involved in acid resistance
MPQDFEQFLAATSVNIPIFGFVINIILTAILSGLLSWIYTKFGYSMSNRKQFSRNFILIAMTTMLVISIVKSSLALSLGLVGALSIIRFRAAIKEPEELAYLFLAIAIGLGLGANQTIITIIAFVVIVIIMVLIKKAATKFKNNQFVNLTIQSNKVGLISIESIIDILRINCDSVDLRRLDENDKIIEASFIIESKDFNQISKAKKELQEIDSTLKLVLLDNKGLL